MAKTIKGIDTSVGSFIQYYFNDKGKYEIQIFKKEEDGVYKRRTVRQPDNIKKILTLQKEINNSYAPESGAVIKNADKIIKKYDNYMIKKNILRVLNPISPIMKVTRKNPTIKKALVVGTLLTVFAINGIPGTRFAKGEVPSISPDYITAQEIQSDSIEEIIDTKVAENKIEQTNENKQQEINQMLSQPTFNYSYQDRSTSQSVTNAKRYEDIFAKYAKRYGVDKDLLIAMASQESSGDHYSHINDNRPAMGIMQVEKKIHIGHSITTYNFETKQVETESITREKLENIDTNIKIGTMILRNCIETNNYNIPLAIQTYNMGAGNMNKVIGMCRDLEHTDEHDLRNNPTNNKWLRYRKQVGAGDAQYVEKIFSYLGKSNVSINKRDGSKVGVNLQNSYQVALNK